MFSKIQEHQNELTASEEEFVSAREESRWYVVQTTDYYDREPLVLAHVVCESIYHEFIESLPNHVEVTRRSDAFYSEGDAQFAVQYYS